MRKMRFRLSNCRFLILGVCLAAGSFSWAQVQSKAVIVKAAKHAFAPPLSQLVPIPPRSAALRSLPGESGRLRMPRHTGSPVRDSVLQASSDAAVPSVLSATSGLNILGVGTGFDGFNIQATVAVPNGAAGPTQFVQIVNDSFAVFNKSTGTVEYGPADGNTLWQALGAPCSTAPNMDEVAQFDKLAQVWVIMMPLYAEPDTLCIAVSTTSNATNGGWNLYAFEVPVTALCGGGGCRPMSDYPKLAVWPDGYYITYNQGGTSNNFLGAAACVVDRATMLTGAAATMQCFNEIPGSSYGTLLPADVDGTTPPPAGTPEYFASFDYNDQSLDLWQFHVNWTTPADSTYTGPTNIPVTAFLEPCGDTVTEMTPSDNCVPQAGTAEMLGAFGDRLMYRLAYRNFGSYQSIVANHTVQVGTGSNQTGIRWYELRNTGTGFEQYQEGTYAPDSSYRWMGSIAMDKLGDMGLGYNVSSSSLSPTIRYTGRLATDTLGQMESEIDVLSEASVAHTSQTNTVRWGDFSSMAIDPTDDCTFWYTGEYQTTTNSNHWSTRIASFSFPACTQSFPLTVNEVGQGTVTSTDGNINCTNGSGTCSAVYASGSSVTLNAIAASGWTFSGWSGACSGTNPCNLVVNSSTSATATFTSPNYTLTVNESGQGTVTSTDGEISCTNGSGHCSAVYASGSSVTLNATAASGGTFSGWSGPCTGSNPCNLVMNTNLTPTATFTANASWTLVREKSNGGAITNLTIPATGTGHLVAVALMFNGKTSVAGVSDNATGGSNTYVSAGARSTVSTWSVEIWYAVNSKPGATVVTPTFAGSPTNVQITVWEVSGLSTSALDATNISSGNVTVNNTVGPMVTTTQRGDFIVSVLLANAADFTAISSGNEFTDDFTTYGNGWAHITSASAAAGTHQASWDTAAPTGVYCASTVAFLSN
jgi:Divergent InlB B-repeat domain